MSKHFSDKAREDFFTHLFHKYYPIMKKQAWAVVFNTALEDDAIQDAFIRLFDKYDVLTQLAEHQLVFYITQTVKWSAMDLLRARGRECHHMESLEEAEQNYLPDSWTVEEYCEKVELGSQLTAAIKMLPSTIRDLMIYKYMLGHTNKELAVHFNCSEDNIRQKLSRARKYLAKLLKGGEAHE